MNISQNINKLLYALKQKGKLYKINSFKFYNEKSNTYKTKYQVLKRKFIEEHDVEQDKLILKEKYVKDYDCYNKIELMKYLAQEHQKGSEADE